MRIEKIVKYFTIFSILILRLVRRLLYTAKRVPFEFGTPFATRANSVLLVVPAHLDSPPSEDYSDKHFVKQFTSPLEP